MAIEENRRTSPVAARTNRVHCFAGRAHEVLDELLGVDGAAFVSVADLTVSATREAKGVTRIVRTVKRRQ